MNYFADNLKYLRTINNLSRKELADKLNINTSTISRWENRQMGATIENAVDVAKFFNITMFELLTINLSSKQKDSELLRRVFNSDDYGEDLIDILNLEAILKKKGILNDNDEMSEEEYENLISFIKNNKDLLIKKEH